jgi:signal transduction histidine kinase
MTTPDHNLSLLETEIRGLTDVSQVIHSVETRDELMIRATGVITEMLATEGSNIALTDPETGDLVFFLGCGEKYSKLKSFHLAEGEGITGHCVRTASSVIVNDTGGDPRFSPRADVESGFTTRSILCVPLIVNNKCIGALSVVNKKRSTGFDDRDRVFCEAVASQIAMSIRNVQLTRAAVEAARLAAVGQAVACVAHSMKNLLYGLQGGLYVFRKDLKKSGADVPMRGLEMIERNFGRLFGIVREMLTYTKERKPEYGKADPNEIIRSVVELMQPTAQERGIRLSVEPHAVSGTVELDKDGIHHCVLNLVSNAIDACEEEGAAVSISARDVGANWIVIQVSDKGCGMDEKTRRFLFQPFFSSKGSKGTGLGLSVTRKIVHEHGGRIEVDSEEGKGSTFRIILPRIPSSPGSTGSQ